MSTRLPEETGVNAPPADPAEAPPAAEVPAAGQDRISPALMVGVFVILLLCVALALLAYQNA